MTADSRERVCCVSLDACRREQHERAHCAECRVLTCRYALDCDRRCWRCEVVPSWVDRAPEPVPQITAGPTRTVMARSAWCEVTFEIDDRARRVKPAVTRGRGTSPADEVGRASHRPVDTRSQTGAQAAQRGM